MLIDTNKWLPFVQNVLPELRSVGWRIDLDESFRFRLAEPEDWYGDAEADGGNDWFGVELGVKLDGQKVNLLPILVRLLQEQPDTFDSTVLTKLPDDAVIPIPLPDGRTLPCRRRTRPTASPGTPPASVRRCRAPSGSPPSSDSGCPAG